MGLKVKGKERNVDEFCNFPHCLLPEFHLFHLFEVGFLSTTWKERRKERIVDQDKQLGRIPKPNHGPLFETNRISHVTYYA